MEKKSLKEEQIKRLAAAKEALYSLENGIWLYHDKTDKCYVLIKERDSEQEDIQYSENRTVEKKKVVLPYGMLLMRLASINTEAFSEVISYLRTELIQLKELGKELDGNDTFYILDRMQEMEYHLYHRLIRTMPFETRESITEDEIEIIIHIFLAEMKRIYSLDLFDVIDIEQLLPKMLLDDTLREELKDFLCDRKFDNDFLKKYVEGAIFKTKYLFQNEAVKEQELINIQTFEEAIALEVYNLWKHDSTSVRYTRCEMCGRLFRQSGGRPQKVCSYPTADGMSCEEKNRSNPHVLKVRNNLKSFISERGLQEYSREIYGRFDSSIQKIETKYDAVEEFEKDVDIIYSEIRADEKKYKNREKNG